jgi:hypothetical protein
VRVLDIDLLEKLAKEATPGPWEQDQPTWALPWEIGIPNGEDVGGRNAICTLDVRYGNAPDARKAKDVDYLQVISDAKYIAACNPSTTLMLIAEIRRLRALTNSA